MMPTQIHSLESYFHSLVHTIFETRAGLHDAEIGAYVANMLCEFSEPSNVYRLRDDRGKRLEDLKEMAHAADPVFGTAVSFDEERRVRQYMGDYALFVAGMCYDAVKSGSNELEGGPTLAELIEVGKQSYSIVSKFDVCEYQSEAPLFMRLASDFERCVLGLALVREKMATASMAVSEEF
jgi:hypothetical protein